ncbi:MAG: hypothetical protein WDM92_15795 [Caulobacteraceae bacterium]
MAAPAALTLARVQAEIEREVGITVSVGLSPTNSWPRSPRTLDKPRGFSVIGAAEAQGFLAPRPVSILPGVGPAMVRALERAGLRTVGRHRGAEARDHGRPLRRPRPAPARAGPRP